MAIKGGQILHVGNGVSVIDRIQTAGPGQLNIPTEKINELGNYKSVATIRDTPDLTFSVESLDVSTEIEALISGLYGGRTVLDAVALAADATVTSATAVFAATDVDRQVVLSYPDGSEFVSAILTFTSATSVELAAPVVTAGTGLTLRVATNGIDLAKSVPVDFASQFKAGVNESAPFKVIASVATPFLYLEQMSYRFGLRDNATQSATMRGDQIFYNPGPAFVQEAAGTNAASQTVVTTHPAYQLAEGDERRVLAVTVGDKRLSFGADYAESYGTVTAGAATTTITVFSAVPTTETIRIIYSSPDELQYPQSVHADTTVKPAAVRGRDIEIYLGGYDPTDRAGSAANKVTSVQSTNLDWRVTLDKDEEFGNYYAVAQDFEVATVNGSIDIKPRDNADMLKLLRKFQGVTDATKVLGPSTAVPLALDIVIKHPDTGNVVKRLHVDDARFTIPGYSGRVLQKLTISVPFESDEGELLIFER